ncbi:lipase, partial [Oryctes borbonicus]
MKIPFCVIYPLVIVFTSAKPQRTFLENFIFKGRIARVLLDQFADGSRAHYLRNPSQHLKRNQPLINDSTPFYCETDGFRSSTRPESVHRLQPGDIDVIGAMGDSLTAGFGALSHTPLDLFRDYRGVSFPIGGEKTWRQYLTLPNILKLYNPNLVGFALRESNTFEEASQFDVAEDSALSSDLPYMTKTLLRRISSDSRVNIKEDWKMIVIFMGANNFCQFCFEGSIKNVIEQHRKDLLTALRMLRENLPRTFVTLINAPYVNLLGSFQNLPASCYISQRISCPCVVGEAFKARRDEVPELIRRWHLLEEEIANYEEFQTNDFVVVTQPLLQDPMIPRNSNGEADFTYFAADCFHFSQKGHALLANALWNDIMSPIGEKQKTIFS